MGYYTNYTLEVSGGELEALTDLLPLLDPEDTDYELCNIIKYGDDADTMKWYDHEEDMRALSAKYPDCLFELSGEGEEAGDLWIKYFKAGKMQISKAQIIYEPYSKDKLI